MEAHGRGRQLQVAIAELSARKLDAIRLTVLDSDTLSEIRGHGKVMYLRKDFDGVWWVLWRHYGTQALNSAFERMVVGESILLPNCTGLNCSEYQIARIISKRNDLNLSGSVTPDGLLIYRRPPGERRHAGSNRSTLLDLPIGHHLTEAAGYAGPLIQALRVVVVSEPLLFDIQHSRAGRQAGQLEYKMTKLDILDLHDKPVRQVKGRGLARDPLANLRQGKRFLTRRMDRLTLDFLSGEYWMQVAGRQYRFKRIDTNEQGDTLLEVV